MGTSYLSGVILKRMKRHNPRNSMDEREKFRKFRELDDAFADALRALDKESQKEAEITEEPADAEASRQQHFEQRLMDLMKDYRQPAGNVSELLETMLALGKIA